MTGLARSTFYYQSHPGAAQSALDATLSERMQALAEVFPRYGYRRMTAQLRREGFQVNHKRVLRLMRASNLLCQRKRRFVRTTDSQHDLELYPNLTKGLELTKINQLWVADITYIHVREGFAYLAVIIDAFSRRVVGGTLSRHIDSELTVAALRVALQTRQPPIGCIHHSDRGVQYAAAE
jgi:transposase InsO family protein